MTAGAAPVLEETQHVNSLKQFAMIFEDHHPLALGARPVRAHILSYHGLGIA